MKDASKTAIWQECYGWVQQRLGDFTHFTQADLDELDPQITRSCTLSTLHGCPADEIEKIAHYLLTEKGFNTFVKCNPTMLGYDYAREALDRLGFEYISLRRPPLHRRPAVRRRDPHAPPGSPSPGRRPRAEVRRQAHQHLPRAGAARASCRREEMYMSGRSLYVLSLSLAQKLSHAFDGTLPISFSGGIDAFNIKDVLETGIQPVTVATTILKPGGVMRFNQMADETAAVMTDYAGIDVAKLDAAVDAIFTDERFHKRWREKIRSRKTSPPCR
jgi:putative selenate reductase